MTSSFDFSIWSAARMAASTARSETASRQQASATALSTRHRFRYIHRRRHPHHHPGTGIDEHDPSSYRNSHAPSVSTSTTDQPSQQCSASTSRFPVAVFLHVGILKKNPLILFEFLPTDIAFVIITQKCRPFLARALVAVGLARSTINNLRALTIATECINASIERIMQNLNHCMIGRGFPDELVNLDVATNDRHLDVSVAQPEKHLACTPKFSEPGEDKSHGFLNVLVGILLDLARLTPAEARGKHEPELSALRFGVVRHQAA